MVTLAVMYVAAQDTGHVGPFPQGIAQTELFPLHSLQPDDEVRACEVENRLNPSISQCINDGGYCTGSVNNLYFLEPLLTSDK